MTSLVMRPSAIGGSYAPRQDQILRPSAHVAPALVPPPTRFAEIRANTVARAEWTRELDRMDPDVIDAAARFKVELHGMLQGSIAGLRSPIPRRVLDDMLLGKRTLPDEVLLLILKQRPDVAVTLNEPLALAGVRAEVVVRDGFTTLSGEMQRTLEAHHILISVYVQASADGSIDSAERRMLEHAVLRLLDRQAFLLAALRVA